MGGRKLSRGERNCLWIEQHCYVPEGKLIGQRIKLRPWQQAEIKRIYDNPAGTRRAILSWGRKNGKSSFAACLLLLHLCGPEAQVNGQLYSTAQSQKQAGILFDLAGKMVRRSSTLDPVVVIRETLKVLACPELGTVYRALSAEVKTAMGLSPSFIVHDELGQVRGPRSALYDALETATGAQDNPLSLIISTQAPTDNDLLSVLIDDALGEHDPRTVVSLHTAPIDLDPFGEEAIRAANPAYGDFLNAREVLAMAADAERMPARQAEFENLILNRRVEASAPWIADPTWMSCAAPPMPLEGLPVYGGLDLSAVNDLTALVLGARHQGVWHVHPTFWLPLDGLYEKARHDRVQYDLWYREGTLLAAPGASVDYEYVAEYLRGTFDRYTIEKIGFDRWGFKHLKPWLLRAGFTERIIEEHFVEFGQGFQDMSPALRAIEADILNQRVAHGGHPVMRMNIRNAVVKMDPAGYRKLAKDKSPGRIDGAVALVMMAGVAPLESIRPDVSAMIV